MSSKIKSKLLLGISFVGLVLFIFSLLEIHYGIIEEFSNQTIANKRLTKQQKKLDQNTIDINDLVGYYSAEQTLGNIHRSASAQIMDINGNLNLLFSVPNYPPKVMPLKVDINHLKLETELLGTGAIVFRQEINEVEITFRKETNIWVLRK